MTSLESMRLMQTNCTAMQSPEWLFSKEAPEKIGQTTKVENMIVKDIGNY